jgi:hypothetical protein
MPATNGQLVAIVTRFQPTRRDPRGMGTPGQATNPANFGRMYGVVQQALAGDRAAVIVWGVPGNFLLICNQYNPADPKFNTWTPVGT